MLEYYKRKLLRFNTFLSLETKNKIDKKKLDIIITLSV